jgi:hypothetical protein
MSSFASLTPRRRSPPAFNSDFYVTAAAVIPVLFLAINVQPVFQGLGITAPQRQAKSPSRGQLMAVTVARIIVYIFMIAGIYGEIAAITALSDHTTASGIHQVVFLNMILLTIAAGAGPILGAFSDFVRFGQATSAEPGKTDPV